MASARPTPAGASRTRGPRWPDLFLVGAAMAGTTVLGDRLRGHPGVFMPAWEQPHYFSRIRPSRRFARTMPAIADERAYLELFSGAGDAAAVGEASTSYLWSDEAPDRIAAACPGARIVIVLRDPIERAWAHHRSDVATGAERRGFLRAVRDELTRPGVWGRDPVYLGAGFYAPGLERYLTRFGRERVQVLFFESSMVDPTGAAAELMAWLGLDPAAGSPESVRGERAAGDASPLLGRTRRVLGALQAGRTRDGGLAGPGPVMDETIRRLLETVYAPDVLRVTELLGTIPPWSLTPGV